MSGLLVAALMVFLIVWAVSFSIWWVSRDKCSTWKDADGSQKRKCEDPNETALIVWIVFACFMGLSMIGLVVRQ